MDAEPLLSGEGAAAEGVPGGARRAAAAPLQRLRDLYRVTDALLLSKAFQVSPWRAVRVRDARVNKYSFPLKFLCHLALIALLCALISCDAYQWVAYERSASALACRYFYPKDACQIDDCLGSLNSITPSLDQFECKIYQRNGLKGAIVAATENYLVMSNTSLAVVRTATGAQGLRGDGRCLPDASTHSFLLSATQRNGDKVTYSLSELTADDYSLLNTLLAPASLSTLTGLQLSLPVLDQLATDIYRSQILWMYDVAYTFSSQVQFRVAVEARVAQICDINVAGAAQTGPAASAATSLQSLQLSVRALAQVAIAVSVLYLLLLLREVKDNLRLYYYALDLFCSTPTVLAPPKAPASPKTWRGVVWAQWRAMRSKVSSLVRWLLRIPAAGAADLQVQADSLHLGPASDPTARAAGAKELFFLAPAKLYEAEPVQRGGQEGGDPALRRLIAQWPRVRLKVKSRIFDGWRLLAVVALALAIYACVIFLHADQGTFLVYFSGLAPNSHRLVLGLATALLCFSLLNTFRNSNRFTASGLVLWGAFFKVQRLLVSILPVGIGLLFLGLALFAHSSERFGDASALLVTIFSVMNCDSIWQTFVDTNGSQVPLSVATIYVTLIFVIFSYLTLRVILAMVESLYYYLRLYTSARRKRKLFRRMALHHNLAGRSGVLDGEVDEEIQVRKHKSEDIRRDLLCLYTAARQFRDGGGPSNIADPDQTSPADPAHEQGERQT